MNAYAYYGSTPDFTLSGGQWALIVIISIISIVALWMIFQKAGVPGWHAVIPILNVYDEFKITFGNGWFFLLMLIPFVNIVIAIMFLYKLSRAFGHGVGFMFGLLFLEPIFLLILAFGKDRYLGVPGKVPGV